MVGDGEIGLRRNASEIPQPSAGAAFEAGAVTAETGTCRRAGGDVGHGVESGVGVFPKFGEVAVEAGGKVDVERGLVGSSGHEKAFCTSKIL